MALFAPPASAKSVSHPHLPPVYHPSHTHPRCPPPPPSASTTCTSPPVSPSKTLGTTPCLTCSTCATWTPTRSRWGTDDPRWFGAHPGRGTRALPRSRSRWHSVIPSFCSTEISLLSNPPAPPPVSPGPQSSRPITTSSTRGHDPTWASTVPTLPPPTPALSLGQAPRTCALWVQERVRSLVCPPSPASTTCSAPTPIPEGFREASRTVKLLCGTTC